jgi:hypothetical protein
MIFLLQYDRPQGRLVTLREFPDAERLLAENARMDLEVALNRSHTEHEVVLLQAENKEALRQTHRRYFADLRELITDVEASTAAFVVREKKS